MGRRRVTMVTILQIDRVRCRRRRDKSSRCGHEKPGENNAGTLSAAIRRWIKFSTSSNPKSFSKLGSGGGAGEHDGDEPRGVGLQGEMAEVEEQAGAPDEVRGSCPAAGGSDLWQAKRSVQGQSWVSP